MPSDDTIHRLLGSLFSASTEPEGWTQFLGQLCVTCGVNKAAIIAHDIPRDEHIVVAGQGDAFDEEGNRLYKSYYWQFDGWTSGFLRRAKLDGVLLGEEIWPAEELHKSIFYNEFLPSRNICQMAGAYCETAPRILDGISLYRGPREDAMGREHVSVLRAIAPHLQIALRTRRKLLELESRVGALETALNSIRNALLLVNRAGKIVFVNERARAILSQSDSLSLRNGNLMARGSSEQAILRALIEKATLTSTGRETYGGGAMALTRTGKQPLHILISPISPGNRVFPGDAAATIFLDDPETQPLVPTDVLRKLYGLSPAEARLAVLVLQGHSITEAAEIGQVSRETAKSQMSAVFAKTGTRRQGDLIRLLSNIPGNYDAGYGSF